MNVAGWSAPKMETTNTGKIELEKPGAWWWRGPLRINRIFICLFIALTSIGNSRYSPDLVL